MKTKAHSRINCIVGRKALYFNIQYCEITFILWGQYSWFLQNTLILEFVVQVDPEIHENQKPTNITDCTVYRKFLYFYFKAAV